jgi:glycosyltransferase involved in cell wall biosynthesis
MTNNKLLILIYADIEGYPPTLNMIRLLAPEYSQIKVIQRQYLFERSNLRAENLVEINVCKSSGYEVQMYGPIIKKIKLYLGFYLQIFWQVVIFQPTTILIYDPIALALYSLVPKRRSHNLWYHNHDILEDTGNNSIAKITKYLEKREFSKLDVFSLPALERKQYFDLQNFKGKFLFIPNFPSLNLYESFFKNRVANPEEFNLIFQGSIGEGHGLELIVEILGFNPNLNKIINLHLKGRISDIYKTQILEIAAKNKCSENIYFHRYTKYDDVPELAAQCDLGIAIFTKTDIMNSTLGTSSNKIYEYAAVGTPIVYYNNSHFESYLGSKSWAFATDLTVSSIFEIIMKVDKNFKELSTVAYEDFVRNYNFENCSEDLFPVLFGDSQSAT